MEEIEKLTAEELDLAYRTARRIKLYVCSTDDWYGWQELDRVRIRIQLMVFDACMEAVRMDRHYAGLSLPSYRRSVLSRSRPSKLRTVASEERPPAVVFASVTVARLPFSS